MCSNKENCCFKLGSSILGGILHFFKGLIHLIPFLVHEILLLVVILSVCVGFTALLSFFHEVCWFRPLGADVQAILALVFLTSLGEGVTLVLQKSYIQTYFQRKEIQFPCIFRTYPHVFWFVTFILALSQLYSGYKEAHPSRYFGNRDTDGGIDPKMLNATSTFFVLCSLSFLTYTLPRKTDWMRYRFQMNYADRHQALGTRLYIVFFFLQAILLVLYSAPLVALAFLCRFTEASPHSTFIGLILVGIVLGMNLTRLEDRYLFHVRPMHPPFYAYENHLAVRVNLFQYVLIPLATISYYGSGPISDLSPGDQFLLFSFFISIALLQAAKCTCNYLKGLQHIAAIGRDRRRLLATLEARRQDNLDVDRGPEAVDDAAPLPADLCLEEADGKGNKEDCNDNLEDEPLKSSTSSSSDEQGEKQPREPVVENGNQV